RSRHHAEVDTHAAHPLVHHHRLHRRPARTFLLSGAGADGLHHDRDRRHRRLDHRRPDRSSVQPAAAGHAVPSGRHHPVDHRRDRPDLDPPHDWHPCLTGASNGETTRPPEGGLVVWIPGVRTKRPQRSSSVTFHCLTRSACVASSAAASPSIVILSMVSPWRIALTTFWSSAGATSPRVVCLPSSQGVGTWVMKNWLPLVPGPALAIDTLPGASCFRSGRHSSTNL